MAVSQNAQASGITEILIAWHRGDDSAIESLFPLVYNDLRRIAARYMRGERFDHTFEPSDLVHAAFLRLPGLRQIEWGNRSHFYAMSARLMRQVLVDYARRRVRRIGAEEEASRNLLGDEAHLLLGLDQALEELARYDPELAGIVEMKFFGDRTVPEIADVTGLSEATVKRRWKAAKGWLHETIAHLIR